MRTLWGTVKYSYTGIIGFGIFFFFCNKRIENGIPGIIGFGIFVTNASRTAFRDPASCWSTGIIGFGIFVTNALRTAFPDLVNRHGQRASSDPGYLYQMH
jgi:hypothetical protein